MKSIKTIFLLMMTLIASQANSAEFVGGKMTMVTPDGEMMFELPPSGFEVADFTSMGEANTLVAKSFEAMINGDVTDATLMVAMYNQGESAQTWMELPLTRGDNGIWGIEINKDLMEEGPGTYTLEIYAKANGDQLLLNNGGQNYKVMFTLGDGGSENKVNWLKTGTAEIILYTGNDYPQYHFNGDGTRDNETMPGSVDMLSVNFFSLYYDLEEDVDITHASLQYMIYPEGENEGIWHTIECNELNTLVSSRNNTHRSSCNEPQLITRGLAPGNYVLRIMYQLIDADGHYYFLGKDNDNFVFYFSINEPADPEILGISMIVTPTPGEEQFPWVEAGEPFETVDFTDGEPLESLTVDEVYIFAQGNFSTLRLSYKVCDATGHEVYSDAIYTDLDDFGNWSTEEQTELFRSSMLQSGNTYHLYFWADGEADGQMYYLNNDGQNYLVKFVYGDGGAVVKPGDLDGSGIVDINDLNIVINMMLGKAEITDAADINNNGVVDINDLNIIINIMLGKN